MNGSSSSRYFGQVKFMEKQIEYEILNFLKWCGFFVWKNDRQGTFDPSRGVFRSNKNPHKIKGVADILGIIDGKMIAIEVKSPKGRLSDEQRVFLVNVNKNGGIGLVSRSAIQTANELQKFFPNNEKIQAFILKNNTLN